MDRKLQGRIEMSGAAAIFLSALAMTRGWVLWKIGSPRKTMSGAK